MGSSCCLHFTINHPDRRRRRRCCKPPPLPPPPIPTPKPLPHTLPVPCIPSLAPKACLELELHLSLLSSVHHFPVGLNFIHPNPSDCCRAPLYPPHHHICRLPAHPPAQRRRGKREQHPKKSSCLLPLPHTGSNPRFEEAGRKRKEKKSFPGKQDTVGPLEDTAPTSVAMSQVKNLRAMFESKGDTSPPDSRGRSPTGGSTRPQHPSRVPSAGHTHSRDCSPPCLLTPARASSATARLPHGGEVAVAQCHLVPDLVPGLASALRYLPRWFTLVAWRESSGLRLAALPNLRL